MRTIAFVVVGAMLLMSVGVAVADGGIGECLVVDTTKPWVYVNPRGCLDPNDATDPLPNGDP